MKATFIGVVNPQTDCQTDVWTSTDLPLNLPMQAAFKMCPLALF